MSDVFGDFPDRPDQPEFWHLSEIVLQMDGRCEEPDGMVRTVEEILPHDVLLYMATQRAGIMLNETNPVELMISPAMFLATLAGLYVDGFIAGAKYQERYPKT